MVAEGVGFGMLVLAMGSSPGRWGIMGISDAVDPDLVRLTERLEASFRTGVQAASWSYLPVIIWTFPFTTLIT